MKDLVTGEPGGVSVDKGVDARSTPRAEAPQDRREERRVEVLVPSCNIETVRDGRGGIFTWIPKDPLVEFNMLYFQPGKTRGNHWHPEFNEYFLVVEGSGIMVWKAKETDPDNIIHMAKGSCVRTPSGIAHAFYAITPVTAIAMLSKEWDKCAPPIIHMHVLEPPNK